MKTKEVTKVEPQSLATQLHEIEEGIALDEARAKVLRELLLENLQSQGVKFVRLANGDSYTVAERNNLVIKNQISATKWAMENPEARMKLDTSKALEIAKQGKSKIFGVEKTYSLRISRAKTVDHEETS